MSQRRSNGIRKLPSGRYQITFRDATGKKHRESFDREKEARSRLDERRTAVRNREYVAPAKIPTVEQAARGWLDGKKVSESRHGGPIKESSIEFWENHIDTYIVPTLGAYRMDCVDTALVEKKRDEWKGLGLTAPSVNKVLTTLSAIFDKQIALRSIRFNPVKLAERIATGSNEVGENDEIDIDALEVRPEQVYGPDQLLKLIQSAEPGFAQAILMTFALTGARHGEGLGLMWRDVDFERKEITIRRNWSGHYRDGEPVFWTPKTKHSIRRVRIPDELCLALKKWKLQCPPSKWDLVFPKADGRPQDRKTTWRAMDGAIKKANEKAKDEKKKLRRLTVHSLRHGFASIHLMNGTAIPEVSAMLGHANVNITLTVYTHFIPKMQTDSSSRLAAAIFSGEKAFSDQLGHLKDTSEEKTATGSEKGA
jgi:integrase